MAKKSYKQKYSSEDGVWRTIGGRRVFIRNGQNLSEAMRESGKFKNSLSKIDKEYSTQIDKVIDERNEKFRNMRIEEMKNGSLSIEGQRYRDEYNKLGDDLAQLRARRELDGQAEIRRQMNTDLFNEKGLGIKEKELNNLRKVGNVDYNRANYENAFIDSKNKAEKMNKYEYFDKRYSNAYDEAMKSQDRFNSIDKNYESMYGKEERDRMFKQSMDTVDRASEGKRKTADFKKMLEGDRQKTLDATRKEINGYFDLPLKQREEEIGTNDDLYKLINENYYNIGREDFDRLYNEEMQRRVAVDTAKRFGAKDVTVNGKKIDLDAERDRLSIENEKKELEGGFRKYIKDNFGEESEIYQRNYNEDGSTKTVEETRKYLNDKHRYKELVSMRDKGKIQPYSDEEKEYAKLRKIYGRDKIKLNSQYTADEQDILDRFGEDYGYDKGDKLDNLIDQIDYMKNPGESIHRTAERLVEGGDFLIYNGDIQDWLDDRAISYNEDNFFDKYKKTMADTIEKLYNEGVTGSLRNRYSGTYKELKGKGMSESEILELLRKIDKR